MKRFANEDVTNEEFDNLKIIFGLLFIKGGEGLDVEKLKRIDLNNKQIDLISKFFNEMGFSLNISENKMFLRTKKEFLILLSDIQSENLIPSVKIEQRRILVRFLTNYFNQPELQPINKEKFKLEFKQTYNRPINENDLKNLKKLGYLNIYRDKFLDIGWKLKNSTELENFQKKFQELLLAKKIRI